MCPNFKSDKIKPVLMCRRSSYTIIAKFQLLNLQRLGINLVRKFVVVKMRIMDLLKKSSTPRIALRAICTLSSLPTLSNQHCATVHTTFCTALDWTTFCSVNITMLQFALHFNPLHWQPVLFWHSTALWVLWNISHFEKANNCEATGMQQI